MKRWEEKIIHWLDLYMAEIAFGFITIIALWVRAKGMSYRSDDYEIYLYPWFTELQSNGGFSGLGFAVGDYYIPYLLLLAALTYFPFEPLIMIKGVSIFFEFLCALVAMKLAHDISGEKSHQSHRKALAVAVYAIVLLSPLVVLNGAFWGQCDYIYGTFMMGSLYCFRRKQFSLSFILLGIAFIFKLQTVFLLPVYLLYYLINREFSLTKFFWLPLLYYLAGLPAVFAGRPFKEVYAIYLRQTKVYSALSMNIPNIWRIFPQEEYAYLAAMGIGAVMVIWMVLAAFFGTKRLRLTFQTFLLWGVVAEGLAVMILPAMHERYAAMLCLLASLYFLLYDWKKIWLALIFHFIATATYSGYLFENDFRMADYYLLFSIVNIAALLYLLQYALTTVKASNDEPSTQSKADETTTVKTRKKFKKKKIVPLIFTAIVLLLTLLNTERFFIDLRYSYNREFRQDIRTTMERHPEYAEHRIYLENARNETQPQNSWEPNLRWEARTAGKLKCVDGGVPAFLEDSAGLLIISKSLWPDHSATLTGRVILLDGSDYIVFCNRFYS